MPTGAVPTMMANKQFKVIDPKTKKVAGWMTYIAKVTTIDYKAKVATIAYSQFDGLVPNKEPIKDVYYKVNILHTDELEYRVNLSK